MSRYKIVLSPYADEAINDILLYVNNNYGVASSQKLANVLSATIVKISEFPEMGETVGTIGGINVRRSVIGKKNVILYSVDHDRKEVRVLIAANAISDYTHLLD